MFAETLNIKKEPKYCKKHGLGEVSDHAEGGDHGDAKQPDAGVQYLVEATGLDPASALEKINAEIERHALPKPNTTSDHNRH